ncbi:MAG: DUF6599 family protein [Candidatus Brocadiia bacterium]
MAQKKTRTWPGLIRRVAQSVAFLLFLIFVVTAPVILAGGNRWGFMRLSPLSGAGASLSVWRVVFAFWPAAVLLVAAIFLGRYFCGWICPLGTTLDLWDLIIAPFRSTEQDDEGGDEHDNDDFKALRSRRLKYYILVVCGTTAIFGLSLFGLFDPLSIAVRSYVLVVHPYLARMLTGFFGFMESVPLIGHLAATISDRFEVVLQTSSGFIFKVQLASALIFFAILALNFLARRFWCRSLCPLGALYALVGQRSLTARKVTDDCISCGRCVNACPMDCISPDGKKTLGGECILCLKCQEVCPVGAVRFIGAERDQEVDVNLSRRGALASLGVAAAAFPAAQITSFKKQTKGGDFIRPPLAGRDPEEFLRECLRCGQCMRVCPTRAIHPIGLKGGLESLWTPQIIPRLGYCQYNCNACGRACPSGAIPEFTLEEKHTTALGLAYVDRTRCIPWRGYQRRDEEGVDWDEHNCGVCEEVCPVPGKAIHFLRKEMPNGQELRRPYVRSEACIGCGFCEHVCPLQGEAAIRVTGGFRELPKEDVTKNGGESLSKLFPDELAGMKRVRPPRVYRTPSEMFSWINGAAEPYMKYRFMAAGMAQYSDQKAKLEVQLWQFEDPADAFGAYSMDRGLDARRVDIGDEGAVAEGPAVWARRGPYYVKMLPMGGGIAEENVVEAAKEMLVATGADPSDRPAICNRLPEKNLNEHRVRFLRHSMHMQDLFLPQPVLDSVDLQNASGAAYGVYSSQDDGRERGLLLIRFPKGKQARETLLALEENCDKKGNSLGKHRGVTACRLGDSFVGFGRNEGEMAVSLYFPEATEARKLVSTVLGK